MQGDFSRLTFNPSKHYRSVRMQQGRVQLDADWNEQVDILQHYSEIQLRDLLGTSGAMAATAGFQIIVNEKTQRPALPPDPADQTLLLEHSRHGHDLLIKQGNYYVDGILCENERDVLFSEQPSYPGAQIAAHLDEWNIVYLDVWQRHITAFEDPALREIALGGPDTTTRTQITWQVRMLPVVHRQSHELLAREKHAAYKEVVALSEWHELLHGQARKTRLAARHVPHSSLLDNQLYRVEIHEVHHGQATFKWSRENGSIVFGIEKVLSYEQHEQGSAESVVQLRHPNEDMLLLQPGDWVEFVCDDVTLHGYTLPLYQVTRVSATSQRSVTLAGRYAQVLEKLLQTKAGTLLVRRWDHSPASTRAQNTGSYAVADDMWLDLERGIQVRFSPGGTYHIGDYWLIPSRTLPDDVEWPTSVGEPLALPPHGVEHHFCPLALIHSGGHRGIITRDLRRLFAPLPVLAEQIAHLNRPEEIQTTTIEQVNIIERNVLYEECSSQDDLRPGDLVSLLPGTNLEVTKATRENAKLLFGVVAGVTEVAGQKRLRVTTYGRARCKVAGAVEAGDLLTVAEENGHAMKTGPAHEFFHAGSLVGKALEAYAPQESYLAGMIEILVSLQ